MHTAQLAVGLRLKAHVLNVTSLQFAYLPLFHTQTMQDIR